MILNIIQLKDHFEMRILYKVNLLIKALIGYCIKLKIDILGLGKLKKLNATSRENKIIVSLTSYGRRAEKVVYYTLVSLLKQTLKPDQIILWLNRDCYNENNLPVKLRKLKKYKVQINFCEDIRSYTKLLPTLELYPNDLIITVDDDIYYSKYLVEDLYQEYLNHPHEILGRIVSMPLWENKRILKSYNLWESVRNGGSSLLYFALGYGGVLYPPFSLYRDINNKELFQHLTPLADDIWFWAMSIKQNIKKRKLNQVRGEDYSFDSLYQYFHKGSALTHQNRKNRCLNDEQIRAVVNYYDLFSLIFKSIDNV